MKHSFAILLSFLFLTVKVNGQAFPGNTWVGTNLEYLKIMDSTADVDISRLITGNGFKYIYTKTAKEHSLSFGTPMSTTIPSDTGRVWIDFYRWRTVDILSLTKDTLILNYTYKEHSILDSIYGPTYSTNRPFALLDNYYKPIIFIDSSKVFSDFNKFQQLAFSSPTENIEIDSLGNFRSHGYILDSSKRIKNYSFQYKLKKKDLKKIITLVKETDITRAPSTENEPFVYDGQTRSFVSVKIDNRFFYYSSKHRQLYWLRSKLIFALIRLHKQLNKERTNSPFAGMYDYSN